MFFSFQKSDVHAYTAVPTPDEELLTDDKETGSKTRSNRITLFNASFWLTAFAALSIAVTIWNLLVIQLRSQELEAPIARPYTGLERIQRNESSPSWPLTSTYHPDFVGSTEGTRVHHALKNNSVVRLDAERTVIIQHRIRDYGLEQCAVKVEFSSRPKKQHEHTARAYGHIGENPYLTLWRLDDSECKAVLTSAALPTSLPSRKEFIGNITLDATHPTLSPFFDCSTGSVQTLEIAMACTSDPCVMEFRLTDSPLRQGFRLVQSEQKLAPARAD